MFLSLRGSAFYPKNTQTFLLIPHLRSPDNLEGKPGNPGEFDSPGQYLSEFIDGPGIRVGYDKEDLTCGYFQGDYRHSVPLGIMAKYSLEENYVRGIIHLENDDPDVWNPGLNLITVQLSFYGCYRWENCKGMVIAEITYKQGGSLWVRLEEAVKWEDYIFALRQLVVSSQTPLFEISVKKDLYDIASAGIFLASDGRVYIGGEVDF